MKKFENIKSVLQEVIITILIAIACILILGVIFYNDMGASKNIPTELAYETPENIQTELDEIAQIKETQKLNIIYTIDGIELSQFQKTQSYDPGKEDPFSKYEEPSEETDTNSENENGTTNTERKSNIDNSVDKYRNAGYNITVVNENNSSNKDNNIQNNEGTIYKDTSAK